MGTFNLKLVVLCLFVLLFGYSWAQNITIPYSCGFEDSVEISNWKINAGPDGVNCQDQWMIGNLDYNEGYNSLYISCDTGKTTNYGAKPNMTIAYRAIEISSLVDTSKTTYSVDISFDWKCVGEDKLSMLKFYFLPGNFITEAELLSSSLTADLPAKLSRVAATATLFGSQDWQSWMTPNSNKMKVDTKYYMIFIWQNSNTDTAKFLPQAAVIDNIQITSSNCWKPENLQVESTCDTLWVTWEGANEAYEFEYRPSGAKVWRSNMVTTEKKIVVNNVAEGSYDVRVRGLCGDEKSAWLTKNGAICFCPDRHCINYVNLDREGVTCEIGKASDPTKGRPLLSATGLGDSFAGPIDYGSNDKRSRHTVNWKQGEFDPRTGNKLRTIPEGSLASVRIGNWDINTQAEGITYDYFVDTTQAFILLMKYAIVLEAPGHGPSADPYFKLEIIDEYGRVIDPNCGEFEFTPENENIKWYKSGNYVWKDWTSIGLNLGDYHGQTIQIRLITQDCTYSAHAGYAYFTLDCADAAIKSTSCGETINMEMVAPDGFKYIWTRRENRDSVISTEQSISVPANDTTTYFCEVDYLDMEGCGFTLFTSVFPRFPFSDFTYKWVPENCENRIELVNLSCVHTKVDGVETPTSEKCETYYWNINGGEYETATENVVYTVPREGDTLKVTLMVGISDDACQDDTTITIIVPPIYEHNDTIRETYCEGNVRIFNDQMLAVPGIYTEYKKNIWGCDSVTVLDLNFVPQPDDVYLYDTICSTEVYNFNGKELNESGEYTSILKTKYGCDSIVILNLQVEYPVALDIKDEYRFVCADDKKLTIEYTLKEGYKEPQFYSIFFDDLAKQSGFEDVENVAIDNIGALDIKIPNSCRPNSYTATINFKGETLVCEDFSVTINFDVYYDISILDVKFNNLITVFDAANNGGYTFTSFKWYKNGELLENDTTSFYYLPEGEYFVGEDCYYLLLERDDDGVIMPTCEICPGGMTNNEYVDSDNLLIPTLFNPSETIYVDQLGKGYAAIYTLTGQLLYTYDLDNSNLIVVPNQSGFYLLQIKSSDLDRIYKIKVK